MKSRAIIAAILVALMPQPGEALDPTQSLDQLRHTGWTLKDGAPGNVRALAQGKNGFLWLGSSTGLYRFDGIRFERILPDMDDPRRSLQVTALLAAHNGDIWVGHDFGGISIYRDGHLRDANPWPPQGGISSIVEARDGSIWVAAESRGKILLSRYKEGRWSRYGAQQGVTDGMMGPLLAASDGSIYLALPPNLLRLAPGAAKFVPMATPVAPFAALGEDRARRIWLADDRGIRPIGESETARKLSPVNTPYVTRHILVDRQGAIWITGQNGGLAHRSASNGRIGIATARKALSLSALEDREGNVWIGTETGIERYASASLIRAGDEALVTGFVAPPRSDHIFFAGISGVYRVGPAQSTPRLIFRKSDVGVLCGNDQRLLAVGLHGAFLLSLDERGDVRRTTPVDGPLSVSCALDDRGQFWTGMDRLYRLDGNRLTPAAGAAGQPGGTITLLRADGQGGLIAGRSRRGLLRIRNGAETLLVSVAASPIGSIITLTADGRRLLIGGLKGLARQDGGGVRTLSERTHPYLAGITAIARTPDGWSWINGATGIVRMRSDAMEAAFQHPDRPIVYRRIGQEADYRARSNLFDANDIAIDRGGRLWFATDQGLAWTDPARLARNTVPPPVVIRSLRVDGLVHPIGSGPITLPAHSDRVQIDYSALSLTDAAQNRFRYRLEGTSGGWVDARTERQALYTNLAPGTYRFRLIAANNDGLWNFRGADLVFEIAPAFYQTRWFFLLCLAAVFALGWLFYRQRLRVATERTRNRVEAQLIERERIARELHDTLLQGFQGLMLRFQAVVELLPKGQHARAELEGALDRAEDVLVESRERVHSLRQELQPVVMADRLRDLLQDVVSDRLDWRVEEEGEARLICAPVADEMARIAREALSNSLHHASAGAILVWLHHAADRVTLSISDDGIGLPISVIEKGMREGHYGMVGMRERARRLGGSMEISSITHLGTTIRLHVPARIAYL
ncbi:sensor histidine kinase [Sphingobium sp.]|uniref:sensor histidine kinase n=1 Tax=Sphingobium sp. TaxID=1912891 RepID=UPI002BE559AD|nr:triple tyrosine motif-containing protein [Sphingobium sp.]HUD92356.1 triple tyrosine motif-containing protein [Sphingobium sp.]